MWSQLPDLRLMALAPSGDADGCSRGALRALRTLDPASGARGSNAVGAVLPPIYLGVAASRYGQNIRSATRSSARGPADTRSRSSRGCPPRAALLDRRPCDRPLCRLPTRTLFPLSGSVDRRTSAGEPAGERVLPPEGPADTEKVAEAASKHGVEMLGPPPGAHDDEG